LPPTVNTRSQIVHYCCVLWSTNSGHWFRFIRPVPRLPLVFCIRCSCVVAERCSSWSGNAARLSLLALGWHNHDLIHSVFKLLKNRSIGALSQPLPRRLMLCLMRQRPSIWRNSTLV
jgi:hypothetical protein